jgi:hypothetical protein
MLVYFTAVWHNLWPFDIMHGRLVWFVAIWYIFPRFGSFWLRKIWQPWLHKVCPAELWGGFGNSASLGVRWFGVKKMIMPAASATARPVPSYRPDIGRHHALFLLENIAQFLTTREFCSLGRNIHPFVHPQGWTLSPVQKNGGANREFHLKG